MAIPDGANVRVNLDALRAALHGTADVGVTVGATCLNVAAKVTTVVVLPPLAADVPLREVTFAAIDLSTDRCDQSSRESIHNAVDYAVDASENS